MARENMHVTSVVIKLLQFADILTQESVHKQVDFVDAEARPERVPANTLILENPFAFLLGVIYDQGQQAERAWYYPYQLKMTLGNLDPLSVAAISLQVMDRIFETTTPLLYYWRMASVRTLRAAYKVCSQYGADVTQIWVEGNPSPKVIQQRFDEFDGVAQKKASMAVNILYRDLGWLTLSKADLKEIDVSNDRHVRRVLLRTGIIDTDDESTLVMRARVLSPEYPGALDLPAWVIGREYCSNSNPNCRACPLGEACPKRIQYEVA